MSSSKSSSLKTSSVEFDISDNKCSLKKENLVFAQIEQSFFEKKSSSLFVLDARIFPKSNQTFFTTRQRSIPDYYAQLFLTRQSFLNKENYSR